MPSRCRAGYTKVPAGQLLRCCTRALSVLLQSQHSQLWQHHTWLEICVRNYVQGLLSSTDITLPQRPSSACPPTSTGNARQYARLALESQRPSSAPAQTRRASVCVQQSHTTPAHHYPLGQISRDCSVNGSTGIDTRRKMHGPSTGSWLTGRGSPDSITRQGTEPQTMRAAAADWQAYYQHRAGVAACSSEGSMYEAKSGSTAAPGMQLQHRGHNCLQQAARSAHTSSWPPGGCWARLWRGCLF